MFAAIITFLTAGFADVIDLYLAVFNGGITLFYDSVGAALTDVGEVLLMGALVSLAVYGVDLIRSLIPRLH